MQLSELMTAIADATLATEAGDIEISSVELDSRLVHEGSLFCCLPGTVEDGNLYAGDALERGAVAILSEHEIEADGPVAKILVAPGTARRSCGLLSSKIVGNPSLDLLTIGVTGTNGKTTVVSLLEQILQNAGYFSRSLGTLTGERTTPSAPELQRRLAKIRDDAASEGKRGSVAMEVSSHALDQERTAGTDFDVAIFTNLSHDHLDYHGSMSDYFEAKARLFEPQCSRHVVIWNVGDAGQKLAQRRRDAILVDFSLAEDLTVTSEGSRFRWRGQSVVLPLLGYPNVTNALLAAEAAVVAGVAVDQVAQGMNRLHPIRGRMERVLSEGPSDGPVVVVDYAHTPDALTGALQVSRQLAGDGRVVVVFGCGGDRDSLKRPLMGAVASEGADVMVVTTDNPRSEDPEVIASAILSGVTGGAIVMTEPDRRAAIGKAIGLAGDGDVVLVAGKGHETTQITSGGVAPFDDVDVARELLALQGSEG